MADFSGMISQEDATKVIDSAQVLLFKVSLDGQILGWNEKAAELFSDSGRGATSLPKIQELVGQRRNKQFDDVFTYVASQPPFEPRLFEAPMVQAANVLPVLLSLVRHDDSAIHILGLVTSSLEQKLVEDMQNRLTSLVTQELRSPLNGMVGLTTALCKSPTLSAPMKKQLGVLRSSSSRLLDLVTNVMDLGAAPQEEAKVNFAELVEEVFVMTNAAVDRSNAPLVKPGVELENKLTDMTKIPLVLGDRHKFLDLLYNLITNACKFTTAGSVTISAEHVNESQELELRIADTGCGIHSMSQILLPFRTDPDRAKQIQTFQGAGLGLAVCRETVELHRGTLTVESSEAGSTFRIRFPCLAEFGEVGQEMPSLPPVQRLVAAPPARSQTTPASKVQDTSAPPRIQRLRPVLLHVDLDAKSQIFCTESFAEKYELVAGGQIEEPRAEQPLVLMALKMAILEHQFQETLLVQARGSKLSARTRSELKAMSKKATEESQSLQRVEGTEISDIDKLKQEMATLRARDLRLADQVRHQSSLNAVVLQESGSGISDSRFAIEQVNLSRLVDEVIAKVPRKVSKMPQGLLNGLQGSPMVLGDRKMIEYMIVKLLEQAGHMEKTASVSIIGKLKDRYIEVTLDFETQEEDVSKRPSIQSFSLQCLPGADRSGESAAKVKRERPLLLVVDDEEQHRSMLQSSLGSEFDVVCQINGKAAMDWLEQQQDLPDLILLDTDMPGITGYEVCRSLRTKSRLAALPILLLHDKAPTSLAALEGLDSGSNGFIVKPFEDEVLKKKVFFTLEMDEVAMDFEIQKQKIGFLELRVSEQAAEIDRLRHQDLRPELDTLEHWKLRSRHVAKRLLLSQSLGAEALR